MSHFGHPAAAAVDAAPIEMEWEETYLAISGLHQDFVYIPEGEKTAIGECAQRASFGGVDMSQREWH